MRGAFDCPHAERAFGFLTYEALVKFQIGNGLPATGFFGPLTRAVLESMTATSTAP